MTGGAHADPAAVRRNLDWLTAVTLVNHSDGPCDYQRRPASRLDAPSICGGWVRMNTHPGCPVHAKGGRDGRP